MTILQRLYRMLIVIGNALRSPVLLIIRRYFGWEFSHRPRKLMDRRIFLLLVLTTSLNAAEKTLRH